MNGIRTVAPDPCKVTVPEYSLAAGTVPESVTVSVVAAPPASVKACWLNAMVTPETVLLAVPLTEQQAAETASVAELVPWLVMVIDLAIGNPPDFTYPNEMVDGSAVTEALTAAPASSLPAPIHSTSTASPNSSVVVSRAAAFTSADLICAGVYFGCACFTSAAAPAVIGVEKLVPAAAAE